MKNAKTTGAARIGNLRLRALGASVAIVWGMKLSILSDAEIGNGFALR
jgi:hypothetical protein